MKRLTACLILLLSLIPVFSACAGGSAPTPTGSIVPSETGAPTVTSAFSPTETTACPTGSTAPTAQTPEPSFTAVVSPSGSETASAETPFTDDDEFTVGTVRVIYSDEKINTTAEVRYYGGVAYMPVETYVSLIFRGRNVPVGREKVSVARHGNAYTVTTASGMPGVFDVQKNTFETANFSLFKNTHFTETGIEGCVSYDALPFILVESVTVDREAQPMKIDFGKYGLKIHGDGETVYLPVTTLSDLFSCQNILVGAYNGKDLYIYNYSEGEYYTKFGAGYFDDLYASPRTDEIAAYNYGEFCLNYDFFLGRSGRSSLERYYDLSGGIDAALESDELGRSIKRYLLSTDLSEYMAGLQAFNTLYIDGGHSGTNVLQTTYYAGKNGSKYPSWMSGSFISSVRKTVNGLLSYDTPAVRDACSTYNHRAEIYAARSNAFGKPASALTGSQTYTKAGDTAIIHIDGFMGEINCADAWYDYYGGGTEYVPKTGGAVDATYRGLIKANEDGVKRVIVDLSANTGGSTDEMLYLISLLTGRSELFMRDRTTGQVYRAKYRIDRNLDRVFDEQDDAFDLIGDKEIAVIVSQNGFSCGGIAPILLHEYGVYTLGENCGGGSCAVYVQHDGFGLMRRASCPIQILTPDGVDIDSARLTSCDEFLEQTVDPSTGKIDYSAFFDTVELARLIDEHYAS
ncbi:MAG: hypothetical protein IJU52_01850 [Clostridia bacterium]|nr:hypothetical protein [Clostridia bacterium]